MLCKSQAQVSLCSANVDIWTRKGVIAHLLQMLQVKRGLTHTQDLTGGIRDTWTYLVALCQTWTYLVALCHTFQYQCTLLLPAAEGLCESGQETTTE